MLNQIPRLVDDLRLRPGGDVGRGFEYFVEREQSPRSIRLSPVGVLVLGLVDGLASLQNISMRLQKLGIEAPEGFLEGLFSALYQLGFAKPCVVAELEHQLLPGTRQRCDGCGRSCQGQLIGPLADSEVERVAELSEVLAQSRERLREGAIARVPGQSGHYFNMCKGQCVFLDDDGLCAIHRDYGLEAKPAICISFPFHRVLTEEGLRVGVSITCFRQHLDWRFEAGLPTAGPLPEALATLPGFTIYHAPFEELLWAPLDVSTRERRHRFLETERRVLAAMGDATVTLAGLAALMMGSKQAPPSPGEALVLSSTLMRRARGLLATFRSRLDLSRSFLGYVLQLDTPIAKSYQDLLATLEAFLSSDGAALRLGRREELLAIDHLRRLFWLREVLRHQSPHHAMACYLLGWMLAGWAGEHFDPEPLGWERFGERVVAWWRFLNEDERFREVLGPAAQAHELLKLLAQEASVVPAPA